jgi:hypothetical protein
MQLMDLLKEALIKFLMASGSERPHTAQEKE